MRKTLGSFICIYLLARCTPTQSQLEIKKSKYDEDIQGVKVHENYSGRGITVAGSLML